MTTGIPNWFDLTPDGQNSSHATASANKVISTTDGKAVLNAIDADSGAMLANAIARNKVFASCDIGGQGDGWLIAYAYDKE